MNEWIHRQTDGWMDGQINVIQLWLLFHVPNLVWTKAFASTAGDMLWLLGAGLFIRHGFWLWNKWTILKPCSELICKVMELWLPAWASLQPVDGMQGLLFIRNYQRTENTYFVKTHMAPREAWVALLIYKCLETGCDLPWLLVSWKLISFSFRRCLAVHLNSNPPGEAYVFLSTSYYRPGWPPHPPPSAWLILSWHVKHALVMVCSYCSGHFCLPSATPPNL